MILAIISGSDIFQGHSNGSFVRKDNFCTTFSNTSTVLREIAHARKGYDNPSNLTTWRASASRARSLESRGADLEYLTLRHVVVNILQSNPNLKAEQILTYNLSSIPR